MKRFLGFLFLFTFLFSLTSFGAMIEEGTADDVNVNLREIYELRYDYFKYLSRDGAQRGVDWVKSSDNKHKFLVYGSSFGKTINWFGAPQVQYFGYANEGGIFENPYFPWNAGWDGTRIENMKLIPTPWKDALTKSKAKWSEFNDFKGAEGLTLEKNIIEGLNEFFGDVPAKKWVPSQPNNNNILYTKDAKHSSGRPWTDFVYIAQPPTYESWGTGIVMSGTTYLCIYHICSNMVCV